KAGARAAPRPADRALCLSRRSILAACRRGAPHRRVSMRVHDLSAQRRAVPAADDRTSVALGRLVGRCGRSFFGRHSELPGAWPLATEPPMPGASRMKPSRLLDSVSRPALILVGGRAVGFVAVFAIPVVLVRVFTTAEFGTYKQLFLV